MEQTVKVRICKRNIMPKMITITLKYYVYYRSILTNELEKIEYALLMFVSWSLTSKCLFTQFDV